MKKLISFVALGLLISLFAGFWSCKTSSSDTSKSGKPSLIITWPGGSALTYTTKPGQILNFVLEGRYNPQTKINLSKMELNIVFTTTGVKTFDTVYLPLTTELTDVIRNYSLTVPSSAKNGDKITVTITLTDANGQQETVSYVITVQIITTTYIYYNVILGAQKDTNVGSFFSTNDGKIKPPIDSVYTLEPAFNNQPKIDWCYFYDNTSGKTLAATIAAPSETTVAPQMFPEVTYGLPHWSVKNGTLFRPIAAVPDDKFDSLSASDLQQMYNTASGVPALYAAGLSDNSGGMTTSYIAFKTVLNKYGFFKVQEVDVLDQSSGYINLTIVIQQ